jgi:hypothetical protein
MILDNKLAKLTDNDYIVERARELKALMGNAKDHSTIEDIQAVANYYGCKFDIRDNLFAKFQDGIVSPQNFKRKQG